jgi:hypothetical protein
LPTGEPAGQSAQTDVVIHDSFNFPPFLRAGHFVITIAAAVCGVMEIKARLTREQLCHAAENIQRARVLNQGQTRGFVLGFEGDSPAVLREELARLDEEFRETPHLLIDGVFVLDHQWGIKRYPARDEYEGAEAFMRFYADLLEALTDFTGIHYGQFPYMAVQSPSAARFPSAGESP